MIFVFAYSNVDVGVNKYKPFTMNPMRLMSSFYPIVVALFLLVVDAAQAAPIYRWVDKQGATHYSSVVPKDYQDVAQLMDQTIVKPSSQERQLALERAAQQKAEAAKISKASEATLGDVASSSESMSEIPDRREKRPTKTPIKGPTKDTDCKTWSRLYQESGECFAPYRVVGGGIKKEAFEHCMPVAQPPGRCKRALR